ncbi:hypothetical protein [Tenacibaculum sp. 190524A05c]|uniref:hypothetical protein n=1 Tax=Tenacibaculum platacis TaxID=3137852 RepID=UPI0032B2943B
MLDNILKLDGVQKLNKIEQKNIQGSGVTCDPPVYSHIVPPGEGAINGGQGGVVYTQQCVRTNIFGGNPRPFTHTFYALR